MCSGVLVLLWFALASVGCIHKEENHIGRLSPECIELYHKEFVTRAVPPRNYKYFHELTKEDIEDGHDDGNTDIAFRIVGGKQISIEQAPYQVLYGKYCGGSLIAPEWVITAAHCKDKEDYVYAGSTYRSVASPYRICAHFIHPDYNATRPPSHDYDYQLILLEKAVPVTRFSRPIAIGDVETVYPGMMLSVSGWGHAVYKQRRMEDVLRQVNIPIIGHEICKASPHAMYQNITDRMFCGGYDEGAKDSCQGDSGGPAVSNGKLIGLVSFGVGCAFKSYPGVYTNIPLMRKWIRSIIPLPL